MTIKLLTKQHLEFLSLKGGCTDSSESKHVKMPHCWKSHVTAHLLAVIHVDFQFKEYAEENFYVKDITDAEKHTLNC